MCMGLTERQKLTITNLENCQNITGDDDIIAFCLGKSQTIRRRNKKPGDTRSVRRRSLQYYHEVLMHYMEKKKKKPALRELMDKLK